MENAVVYLRVSSDKQAKQDLSIPSQKRLCSEYAVREGYNVVQYFNDEGKSARTDDRPGFLDAIDFATNKLNNVKAFICYDTSRFARNRGDAIMYKALLKKSHIKVLFATQNFDDDSEDGKFMEGVFESMDQYYSDRLARVARRGMIEAAKRKYFTGGGVPYGYSKVPSDDGRHSVLKISESEAEVVRYIFDLYIHDNGYTSITSILKEKGYLNRNRRPFTRRAIETIISNPIYIGQKEFGRTYGQHPRTTRSAEDRIIIDDYTDPIVERDIWDHASEIRHARDKEKKRRSSNALLFSGLVYCAKHKQLLHMSGGTSKTGRLYNYYICSDEGCSLKLSSEQFDSFLFDKILNKILSDKNIERIILSGKQIIANIERQCAQENVRFEKSLKDIERKIKNILDSIENGLQIPELQERYDVLKQQKDDLVAKQAKTKIKTNIELPAKKDFIIFRNNLIEMLQHAPVKNIRLLLKAFIDRVLVSGNEIKVIYRADLKKKGSSYRPDWLGVFDELITSIEEGTSDFTPLSPEIVGKFMVL